MKSSTRDFFLKSLTILIALWILTVPVATINGWVTDPYARSSLLAMSLAISFGLWSLITQALLIAAAGIYGVTELRISRRISIKIHRSDAAESRIKFDTVLFIFLSALSLIYCFAILYGLIASLDSNALKPGKISFASCFYFSFLVMTNSLNGDILPVSDIARTLTVVQMAFGMFYALFFFSFLAFFIRDKR